MILNMYLRRSISMESHHTPLTPYFLSAILFMLFSFLFICFVFILLRPNLSALHSFPCSTTPSSLPLSKGSGLTLHGPSHWQREGSRETPHSLVTVHRFVLDSSCLYLSLLGFYHTWLTLKLLSVKLLLTHCYVYRAWLCKWLWCIVFSLHFLFTHQTGCLATCLFRVRKEEIVTADGKMWKFDNDHNKEEQGSNRGNEEGTGSF